MVKCPKELLKFNRVVCVARRRFWRRYRFLALVLIAGSIASVCWFTRHWLFDPQSFIQLLQRSACCMVPFFLGLYIVLTVLGIPGTVLTTVGGIVFGLSWGSLWSVLGATLGALGAFWFARYLCQDWANQKFRRHRLLKQLHQGVNQQPLSIVLALRFAPISPFNLVNFLFGLTSIHWIPYTIGTFIGIIPGTILYTWLGVSGKTLVSGGDRLPFILALIALGMLSIASPLFFKKCQTHNPGNIPENNPE